MALVESVIGEFRQQIENLVGLRLGQAVVDRALHEATALRVHLRLDLLAHGAAEHVGFAERIAGQDLRDLHHLFLIDDDAEGLFEDLLQFRVDVVRLLLPGLHRAIARNIGHGTRPVERDQRDDVLESVGAHLDERLAHAGAFELEHADRLAATKHLVSLFVIERDLVDLHHDTARGAEASRKFDSVVSVLRPRKSNFTSPAGSTHFMLNWVAGMSDFGSR